MRLTRRSSRLGEVRCQKELTGQEDLGGRYAVRRLCGDEKCWRSSTPHPDVEMSGDKYCKIDVNE